MIFQQKTSPLDNLHTDLIALIEKKKLNVKAAHYLADLDIDAEQLWVQRYYLRNGILPTIKQARQIWEAYEQNQLTLKAFREIMAVSLVPQKLVFNYSEMAPFFDEDLSPDEMKRSILKVLSNWKNNINR